MRLKDFDAFSERSNRSHYNKEEQVPIKKETGSFLVISPYKREKGTLFIFNLKEEKGIVKDKGHHVTGDIQFLADNN
ncbi:hypothetical protein [Scopulibacillus daqui]|uniref:hypothetical protein n=1 Tax=Scopulibacillus daqui TaxID=1469162 RepID=UPI00195F49E9|nr:hypothetical protein [Scopulibacillus daqui]